MYEYLISGKIHPERVGFTLDIQPDLVFNLKQEYFDIEGQLSVNFINSNISCKFVSNKKYSAEVSGELETLKNQIETVVRSIVDVYCFVKSYGYEVEITDIKSELLKLNYQFGVRGEWNIQKTQEETNKEFLEIMALFASPEASALGEALADFRRSVRYPMMTASFCYRAIETLRQAFFENSWGKLRSAMNLAKEDFDEILSFATPNRHGKYPAITYKERERIMNFTRTMINKTVEHLSKKDPPKTENKVE